MPSTNAEHDNTAATLVVSYTNPEPLLTDQDNRALDVMASIVLDTLFKQDN